jgi:hypothetical protein
MLRRLSAGGGKIRTFNCYWSAATVLAQLGVLGNLQGATVKAG